MDVLVDTSVWSLAYRRSGHLPAPGTTELARLIQQGRAVMIGPVRQEILSGIRDAGQSTLLRDALRAFPDLLISTTDYEQAAVFFNRCRSRRIHGTHRFPGLRGFCATRDVCLHHGQGLQRVRPDCAHSASPGMSSVGPPG